MARGLVLVVLLLLVACFTGCPGRASDRGEGEGEGEGEGDVAEGIPACVADSDCGPASSCIEGGCLALYNHTCLDDRYVVEIFRSGRRDCAYWGGACVAGTGCVLPRGAVCSGHAPCAATGGAQACLDGTCPETDVDDHLEWTGATPVPLPSTTTMNLVARDVDCVTATASTRGVVEVHHNLDPPGVVKLGQAGFRNAANGVGRDDAVAIDAGPFTLCASSEAAQTVTIALSLTTIDAIDTVCLDDDHLRRDGVVEICPAGTRCTHRVGAPACRLTAGGDCEIDGDDCVGVCERIAGVGTCSDARPDIVVDIEACRDNAFFIGDATSNGGFAIQTIDHCGDATCLPGRGCVVDVGDTCFEEQFCAADTAVPCTGGVCE